MRMRLQRAFVEFAFFVLLALAGALSAFAMPDAATTRDANRGSARFIAPDDRIASSDSDGTVWTEPPITVGERVQ